MSNAIADSSTAIVATESQVDALTTEATEEVSGGVLPIVAAAGAGAAFVAWCANGGYQDAVDLASGFMEGWASATN